MSLGFSFEAPHNLKAPTLFVEVMISPEMLSTQLILDIPVGYFSKIMARDMLSTENKHILPFSNKAKSKFSPGFQARSSTSSPHDLLTSCFLLVSMSKKKMFPSLHPKASILYFLGLHLATATSSVD